MPEGFWHKAFHEGVQHGGGEISKDTSGKITPSLPARGSITEISRLSRRFGSLDEPFRI